jgi:hypothetical protein
MSANPNETIKLLDDKIAQLKARKRAEENKLKKQVKRERAQRLIKYGELVEKYLDSPTVEALEELLKNL